MYAAVLAALYEALSSVFTALFVKGIIYGVLVYLVSDLVSFVQGFLPSGDAGLAASMSSGYTAEVWFFFDLFGLGVGLPLILGAYVTRFIIRRIPFFG